MAILELGSIVLSILNKFFPDQSEIKKADIQLKIKLIEAELLQRLSENSLLVENVKTNTAEAANPNRKWITWRELIGYACATALWWFWILQPFLVFISVAAGHPIDVKTLPTLEITDILVVVGGMLGIPVTQYIGQKIMKGKG